MAKNMQLPPMMAIPPATIRAKTSENDWNSCIEAWSFLSEAYLSLPQQQFSTLILQSNNSFENFLVTYVETMARGGSDKNYTSMAQNIRLHKSVYRLLHRILSESKPIESLVQWRFLGFVSRLYRNTTGLPTLLQTFWNKNEDALTRQISDLKDSLTKSLDAKPVRITKSDDELLCLPPLVRTVSAVGRILLTGSDFLDSVVSAYDNVGKDMRSTLLLLVYLCLDTLLIGDGSNHSLLLDHLYSMKATLDNNPKGGSQPDHLLLDLVRTTPILPRLRKHILGADGVRASGLIASLTPLQRGQPRHSNRLAHRTHKGKARATDGYAHDAFDHVHVHRMSLITQVQDLFPALGSGFIVKLLDEYNENIEEVTMHLLEDSLPPHLQNADRSENIPQTHQPPQDFAPGLSPRATPPPSPPRERRNVFDNDDFDRLAVDTSKLHMGRKNASTTADKLLSSQDDKARAASKAAIMSALAAFDADDDERDDTYDLQDVGGTVDSAQPGGADEADVIGDDVRQKNEATLFSTWSSNPELFQRDSATRRGQPRQVLKRDTGMTDEAIEGWAVMLGRDPRMLKRLQAKYAVFNGRQNDISTPAGSGTEDSEASGAEGGRGGFRGRGRGRGFGRGRGGGRTGGDVSGPANEKSTEIARNRKEANKSSRANHNRRDQRARKMARAGFPG